MKYATDHKTNHWLKTSGINPCNLITSSLLVLQAEKTANWLIKLGLINKSEDEQTIKAFMDAVKNPRSRQLITDAQAYEVLNLGTKARRKIYKVKRTGA
jgi:hypothetical protein